ncbi:MAG: hypothetical protein BA861_00190 [Desulfobacterales bacterium S3730MH5]|nr:MAG: hypothetical protein BA861_00190 [Desulfobacterales bacterium S3730MH5]
MRMVDQIKNRKAILLSQRPVFRSESQNAGKAQSPDKFEILFVIGSLDIGGAERQMFLLVNHLTTLGHSCQVFTLEMDGPLRCSFDDIRVPVHVGGLKKGDLIRAPWKLILAEWRLMRIILKRQPDVVHAFLPLVTFLSALAGRVNRVRLVITSRRGLSNHQDRHLILKPLDRIANGLSHKVTVNSQAVWNDILNRDHIDPSKLVLVYNGVDPDPFESARPYRDNARQVLGIRSHEKITIVVANLIAYKGHSDLLKAARLVIDQIHEARFLLVGEDRGIQRDLENEVLELGISEHVKFLGGRDDIPYLLAASDLSVLPSHEEGFSNVILESMAAGLPVVASRVGGNAEAVLDGVSGWLVPLRNSEIMAEKIIDLLKEPEKSKKWGEVGKRRIKDLFSIEKMVQKHLRLYEESLRFSTNAKA